jgi:hypothetical protein
MEDCGVGVTAAGSEYTILISCLMGAGVACGVSRGVAKGVTNGPAKVVGPGIVNRDTKGLGTIDCDFISSKITSSN